MAKPGRNDPCSCGSGNKYKKCCLMKDEAAEGEVLAVQKAARDEHAATHQMRLRDVKAAIAARFAEADGADVYDDGLLRDSMAVGDLIRAGLLDKAETAARHLLERYPEVHDGWDHLGMVYEARGETGQAAECYRRVLDHIRQHPDDYDPEYAESFAELIARLDSSSAET